MDPIMENKYLRQGEMLANKAKKKFKHLKKRFAKQGIEVFRIYDWDIPEIRAVVDWYAGHLVVGEYTRAQSTPEWLPMMGQALADAFDVPMEKVHLKQRKAGRQNGKRYERIDHTDAKIIMGERDLKFYVNPCDYVDTGLFSDHRNTRLMVREMAEGKHFLNLYCYTGAFTCYAAKGGAATTTSVDRSETAVNWVKENLELNGLSSEDHEVIQKHTPEFLEIAKKEGRTFDLAVVDPPSYSTTMTTGEAFDIDKDHPWLLNAVVAIMKPGSTIFFSTNHQDFTPKLDVLPVTDFEEITHTTIPEDYISKRKTIHRCWKITV
ncbi:s-adenosyl-l-methionine-dependent methyltransferase [Desulfoluna butyratoxydans]|uniref:S-adenosyl-l-methionine-dependent methyltransferase n=2 Tax=Desulfoluna butyratoxydans TaxID=231438 RepID=A0A4U8YI53_9BACT|nr:s-adenosyl-l-methionine-dependent methyltransferase [Desulfoluna butyratoxydans]